MLLYLQDDMAEFLGPEFLGTDKYMEIVRSICGFTSSKTAAIRQAAVYGIGIAAETGGAGFAPVANLCLEALNKAIEIKPGALEHEKK